MADASGDWITALCDAAGAGPFTPYAVYGAEEDALTVYISPKDSYADRLGERVTVFYSLDNNELVGCQIKCVRSVLEDIGWFDVSIKHGKARLDLLFVALRGEFGEDDTSRRVYRRLGEQVAGRDIEVDVPEGETCGA